MIDSPPIPLSSPDECQGVGLRVLTLYGWFLWQPTPILGVLVAQMVKKNLPAMQETQVRSLGRDDPPEEETATHSSILAWEISWTEEPGRRQSMGLQKVKPDPILMGFPKVTSVT